MRSRGDVQANSETGPNDIAGRYTQARSSTVTFLSIQVSSREYLGKLGSIRMLISHGDCRIWSSSHFRYNSSRNCLRSAGF
jgi:hypothetical protein